MGQLRNGKIIILGEVNAGKTTYLAKILKNLLENGERDIAVIDMAPSTVKGIGGKMSVKSGSPVRYYTGPITAPRLMGKTAEEVETLAANNKRTIERIFSLYLENPSRILLINDVSIYLQAGSLDSLISFLASTPTVIMNGYYGTSLGGGQLGKREQENMKALREKCDLIIEL